MSLLDELKYSVVELFICKIRYRSHTPAIKDIENYLKNIKIAKTSHCEKCKCELFFTITEDDPECYLITDTIDYKYYSLTDKIYE